MTKGKDKAPPLRLGKIDLQLELAIDALRKYARHLPHGRLRLELERDGGSTVEYRIERDTMTGDDYGRLMTKPPSRKE